MRKQPLERWTTADAAELYGIREWAAGYFDISEQGSVVVRPRGAGSTLQISLPEIVSGLRERGLALPVLLRFGNILESRVSLLNETFGQAIKAAGYRGTYRGVYPIKVNQQEQVIEEIVRVGRRYHHGLEVGSKAELIAALAYATDPEALIVCNGYKDEAFIRLALYGLKMGLRIVLVIEMKSELDTILQTADELGVVPQLGIRVKLSSRAGGLWTESAGDRSSFGLTAGEIIKVVDRLKEHGRLDSLRLLHYHLGSQIPNIRSIRSGIYEASRFYVDLVREGAPLGMLDVGGGLAVDYDGSHTNFASSSNYGIEEYCADIIEVVMDVTDQAEVAHPMLVTESGRAIVAYHSVLLFNVLDASRIEAADASGELPEDAHELLENLMSVSQTLCGKNVQEGFHDATFYRDQIRSLFTHGSISLRQRALAEAIFWNIIARIAREIENFKYVPDELKDLETAIADVYYGNFSVFQSLPDAWAIGQLFPIMPIHRLSEPPTRNATLADITCDCDGKIDKFTDLHDVRKTLPLHELNGEDYILGVFLIGAYQETLGDLHNLLGDTNVVGVHIDEEGNVDFACEIEGDSVSDVLSYVEYDPKELVSRLRKTAERSVREGRITASERRAIMEAYAVGLRGYTYFER